jgi:hypothetical protein
MELITALPAGCRMAQLTDLFTEIDEGYRLIVPRRFYRARGSAFSIHRTGTHTQENLLMSDIRNGWIFISKEENVAE